jgi:hypothetical protein
VNSQHRYPIAILCAVHLLAGALWSQEAPTTRPHGVPQDWSDHSIVFTLDGLALNPDLIYQEPRVLHQLRQRFQARAASALRSVDPGAGPAGTTGHQRDWNFALVRGHVAPGMYPAKYSFDPAATPSCQNDYVVFGLNTAGSTGGQANLLGLNNLYAGSGGLCSSGPSAMFAYNTTTVTGGKIVSSPVISLDGSKIAFVESAGTASVFHVLKWTAGQGAITNAAAPSMTSLTYSSSSSTTSAPWVDYSSDVAYIADDNGVMYKITPVFKGTPGLVTTTPWPVTVASGTRLGPPVLDRSRGLLLAGARNGNLYEVNTTSGAVSALIVGAHGATNPGILSPPIVDVTSGTAFVVSSNNGTNAILQEVDTTLLTVLATAPIGLGSAGGTSVSIYQPAVSNDYYNNPSSGAIYTCGTGSSDTTPWQYSFGFTGRTMLTTPASSSQLLTSSAASCSPWTEFFNPHIGGVNGTDFFFFGLTQDCTGSGTLGCVAEITTTSSTPTIASAINGGPSGIVVDNWNTTVGQASSIYLTAEKANTAYKLTQNGLQ